MEEPANLQFEEGGDDSDSSEDASDSSASEEEEVDAMEGLSLTEENIARNYPLLGKSVPADPPLHRLKDLRQKYPFAFTELSESTLSAVLKENTLQFQLSDFQVHIPVRKNISLELELKNSCFLIQVFAINCLFNGYDLITVQPTCSKIQRTG